MFLPSRNATTYRVKRTNVNDVDLVLLPVCPRGEKAVEEVALFRLDFVQSRRRRPQQRVALDQRRQVRVSSGLIRTN